MNRYKNNLIIASAGSGKTTYLVSEAIANADKKILLTTFTRSNAEEIRNKLKEENKRKNGIEAIPNNVIVLEWFTFLLKHGVRPFKALMNKSLRYKSITFLPDFNDNNNYFISSTNLNHYLVNYKIKPNVISQFIIECNKRGMGEVIMRLEKIFDEIYIDEVQDLSGQDLEILKLLFKSSIKILLVGDPRQTTYSTHFEKLHKQYRGGKIKEFVEKECKDCSINIDEITLKYSHRNNESICNFSSNLYPNLKKSEPCECMQCRQNTGHDGVFILRKEFVPNYLEKFKNQVCILKDKLSVFPEKNFGDSKGLTFDRVLIYPTNTIINYLKTGALIKKQKKNGRSIEVKAFDIPNFYVAVTRARYSVAIVVDYEDNDEFIKGLIKYQP